MEPELECFDAQTHKAAEFGELKGGFMVRCSLRMCRQYVLFSYPPTLLLLCAHTAAKAARSQTLPPALHWIALPFRSRGRYKWESMDKLKGSEAHYCDCEVHRDC